MELVLAILSIFGLPLSILAIAVLKPEWLTFLEEKDTENPIYGFIGF